MGKKSRYAGLKVGKSRKMKMIKGPNKGKKMIMKKAKGGHPYPVKKK